MKLLELYNEALESPLTFTTFDDDGRVTISAMVGRTNVGYIIIEQIRNGYWMFEDDISEDEYYKTFPDDSFLKIEHLLVLDDYKSGGYGKQLLNKAIKYGKEIGENIIYLNASPMGSSGLNIDNLVNFYKGFGFKTLTHSEKWSNNKEMVLNLSPTINESETNNNNTSLRKINEGIVKSELVNIDDDELYDYLDSQANTLRTTSEISFGSADPFEILYDDETGRLVGATWIETSGAFSPHMIIDPKYRKMGLSQQLIDGVVEKYKKMKQLRGDNYTFMLNVVNSSLANTMEKHYGFKKVSEDPNGNITMTL